jgi:hypothetical protein
LLQYSESDTFPSRSDDIVIGILLYFIYKGKMAGRFLPEGPISFYITSTYLYKGDASMRRFSFVAVVVSVGLAFMLAGCAKEPVQEIAAAQAAVAAAKAVQAEKYLAREFASADEALKTALAEVKKQKIANPLSRNYEKAKADLASVVKSAALLKEKAGTEKVKVQADLETALSKLKSAVTEAKALVKKAPAKSKEAKTLLEAKAKEIEAEAAKATDIKDLKKSGEFIAARDAANSAIAAIESIKAELVAEIEKAAPKARKKK